VLLSEEKIFVALRCGEFPVILFSPFWEVRYFYLEVLTLFLAFVHPLREVRVYEDVQIFCASSHSLGDPLATGPVLRPQPPRSIVV